MAQEKINSGGKKAIIAVVCLIVVAAAMFFIWRAVSPKAVKGGKHIVVEVTHGDGSDKEFQIDTDEEFLGKVLVDEGIVEDNQSDYGLYILTADGETADESKQEWWCITRDGQSVDTGADTTPVEDGARYELTLKVGYDY